MQTREWTNEERKVRWPVLDYSKGDRPLKPEFNSIYLPHNALRSDVNLLIDAVSKLDVVSI